MALGDTARLIASLELQDKFSATARSAEGRLSALERATNNAGSRFAGLSRLSANTGAALGQMGRGSAQVASGLGRIGLAASAVAAGGLVAIVKSAADFEQAFAGITKTVEATPAQFAELNEQFREMARTIPVSFEELAGIGATGGALGIARQDLLEFTDVVARLSVSTNLSSDAAATALGHLGTILNFTGADFRDFADSLVALGNQGASTEAEIVNIANRFAAAGRQAGLTTEEILALSSATASMGIQQEAAGSSLSRVFGNIAAGIGTSSDKAKAFADTIGLSAREFRDAWREDALGTFQDFLRELGKLDQFKQAKVLEDIGITGVRDRQAVLLMTQNIDDLAKALDTSRKANNDLNKESQKFFDTAAGQWKTLVNIIRDSAVTIGNEVLPVTKDLIKQLGGFLQRPEVRAGLKDFGKDLASTIKSIDFGKLIESAKTAVNIAKTAFDIFNALPGPIKAALIGGVALNRATFGGLGLLTRGIGNLVAGGLKLIFPKLDIFSRGSLVNPMFVSVIGGLPGGLPGTGPGGVPAAGKWGWVGNALKVTVIGAVAVEGIKTAFDLVNINDPRHQNEVDPTRGQRGTNDIDERIAGLEAVAAALRIRAEAGDTFAARQLATVEAQLRELRGVKTAVNAEGLRADRADRAQLDETKAGRLAAAHTGQLQVNAFRTLERRLIHDKDFKPKVDSVAEFLRILKRTSEFGRKGVGTDIEFGPKTGRDPVGDAFLALVRRLPTPLLKNVQVSGEINRHVQALTQVQGRLLRAGNIEAAHHAQRNINALLRLIGGVDKHIPHFRQIERQQERTKEETRRGAAQTANHLRTMQSLERRTGDAAIVTSRKEWSTEVNVTVPVTTTVSVNDVIRNVTHATFAAGSGPGGAPAIPNA